jgi:hypothetical protein
MPNTSEIPFVLQNDYLSVIVGGKMYPISKGQPTFKLLHQALSRKQWSRVPKLLSLATQMAERSHGKVAVNSNGVFYKGQKVDNVLTAKIVELIEHGKPAAHMLRFMDNLYQQQDANTVNEIYQWLSSGRFALTDDGCFIAYKKVSRDYKDIHTGTIDNHVGQVPMIPRSVVDSDRRNECSVGLHFCSKEYLPKFGNRFSTGDSRIMEIKVNPADVVAIPLGYGYTKGRCWRYEVLREIQPDEMIEGKTDSPVMMQPLIEIASERKALIKQVMALPTVKRFLRCGKMTPASFSKASTKRLTSWLTKFSRMDIAPVKSKLFDNPLRFAREAAGLSMGQVAKEIIDMDLKDVYNAERSQHPSQEALDKILTAIAKLQGNEYVSQSGVSYPRPTSKTTRTQPENNDEYTDCEDEDEYEEEDWDED